MPLPRRRVLELAAGAVALPALARAAFADDYPSRPITLIVPFAPGGLADLTARLVSEGMRSRLGQTIVIENVGGANGSIGTGRVARATPDGYTLVLGIWNTHVSNGATYSLPYDVVTDFEPIALLADAPLVMVVKKATPANNLKEFVAWVRANPDKVSFATVGAGSPGQLLCLLLEKETGAHLGQVAYRGAGPAMQDIVAGQIDGQFGNTATTMPHVRAGSVKAFAVTAPKRLPIFPEVPSADEAGVPSLHFSLWGAMFAPAHTPRPIIEKLNGAAVAALADPAIRDKLVAQGFEIPPPERQTPEALAAYQKSEIERWWPIIKAEGVKAD
jgi:tripartite-type tricarboxylate transporter receptor subunit TctC